MKTEERRRKGPRQNTDPLALSINFIEHLKYTLAVSPETAEDQERYKALVLTIRDHLIERWLKTQEVHLRDKVKTVYYFSFEFLMGRAIGNNVLNMGFEKNIKEALVELGFSWEELKELEVDAALGNGGLGRLAACFMDSLSTLEIPAMGYGLRYEYGLFRQKIEDGYQVEYADDWLQNGNPWEIPRYDIPVKVRFGGKVVKDHKGRSKWKEFQEILAIPYDMPVVGYGGNTVNTLRLWKAESLDKFDYNRFNRGDYYSSVESEGRAAALTKVLYPNDSFYHGQELRFRQQYFFVSASLQDVLRRFERLGLPYDQFPDKAAMQLNDTHPTMAIPELMRLLIDEKGLEWQKAWDITVNSFGFTNHTLMGEALETWPLSMVESLLPRHLEIIYGINHHFLQRVSANYPGDFGKLNRMSLIQESDPKRIRMAHMAIVGSHSTNGVAELHSELVKTRLVPDFYHMFPERFSNKTNGVTQRRWLLKANPPLSSLITEAIGDGWITDLSQLERLKPLADDAVFREKFGKVKQDAKVALTDYIMRTQGIRLNPESVFDVQVKRIHEYKRQLLNILHIIILYNRVRQGQKMEPHTFLIGGKAAPGYEMAKTIIKLATSVGAVIDGDPDTRNLLKLHFLPDYRVSMAEWIFPASDISEQISTAGTEASGTGNMKFLLNGALTIGTLDGANIEIAEEVGKENIYIFGKTAQEIEASRQGYYPEGIYLENQEIRDALNLLFGNHFNISEPGIFDSLRQVLLVNDHYRHLLDLPSYSEVHTRMRNDYADRKLWNKKAILNIGSAGKFSSDRTIMEYARDVWDVTPHPVNGRIED